MHTQLFSGKVAGFLISFLFLMLAVASSADAGWTEVKGEWSLPQNQGEEEKKEEEEKKQEEDPLLPPKFRAPVGLITEVEGFELVNLSARRQKEENDKEEPVLPDISGSKSLS